MGGTSSTSLDPDLAEATDGSSAGGGGGDEPSTATATLWASPDWITSLSRAVGRSRRGGDDLGIPVASAKLDDVRDLLGGTLFLPLFKWFREEGPVYRLAVGPQDFVIVSDPAVARHVLLGYGSRYAKGLVAEVSEFLFGSGFAITEGDLWTVRRRAVVPSLHKRFLSIIMEKVFCKCAERLIEKLEPYALSEQPVNMEARFSQLTLDVIGLSLFNYNFDSLTTDSPVIDAVYTALKEAELRSTDLLPYWKIDFLCKIIPRQIKAENAVRIIRNTVEELIMKCKEIVEAENEQIEGEEYVNEGDPSILRFLLASRDEVSSVQLRDDLLSMLVAGHETTGGYNLMGCIKEIPTLKGDNYTEWRKKIDLAFILAEVDWVVTSPCPTEPVAPVRETNEADAAWATRERDFESQMMSYVLEHRRWVTVNKKCLAVIKNMIEPAIMGPILECDTVTKYLDRIKSQFTGSSKTDATQLIKQLWDGTGSCDGWY
ncbi:carotene epsilon-monooxygenase, chloroplastic-like [Miscanthus floridulus]|uniref:carotene epsilon-monooxygenase, chloroplastic-like n=1 Tax=Miscanthus floridulus TaxID=154761 RepID=UPI0034585012